LIIRVTIAKMTIKVLGAQAHFSTTQQIFSSPHLTRQNKRVFRDIFLQKQTSAEGPQGDSCQNGNFPFTGAAEV